MGPAGSYADKHEEKSLKRYHWDMRSVPWTDGRGPQDEYADAVERWCDFHDLLEDKNPNKIPPKLRGTMLWAHLSGRVKDFAKKIPREILLSEDRSKAFFAALHRSDPLSVVSTVYANYATLFSSRRSDKETYKAFEPRFDASVSRFRSHGDDITIKDSFLALMLLNGARMNENQRIIFWLRL